MQHALDICHLLTHFVRCSLPVLWCSQVAQVFGYNLALIIDGDDQAQEEAEQLEPLALTDLKARLTTAGNSSLPAAAGQQHKVNSKPQVQVL